MQQEQKMILEMLKDGNINVEEAEALLDQTTVAKEVVKSTNRKFIRILVTEGENTNVNINIPLALAEAGLKLVPQDKLKIEGHSIDLNEIQKLIADGVEGELVNIQTNQNGNNVKVTIIVE